MDYTRIVLSKNIKPQVLALGAQSKGSFCFVKDGVAYYSKPCGDLSDLENLELFKKQMKTLRRTLKADPDIIACDLHPEYISTRLADEVVKNEGLRRKAVQHHEAHIASSIVDNNIKGRVIGIAFDGTGFGLDGNIWGGEFFIGTLRGFKRVGHLRYIPMPGGEASVREPWRMAMSYLYNIGRAFPKRWDKKNSKVIMQAINKGINSPLTSSMGRLFDAVSSLAGICDIAEYEAQGAIGLEKSIDTRCSIFDTRKKYAFDYRDENGNIIVDWAPVIRGVIKDKEGKKDTGLISLKFHNAVCYMIKDVCSLLRKRHKINKVSLSGGVFQNRFLTSKIRPILEKAAFRVYLHKHIPAHDGNIALGQAALATRG